MPVRLQVFIGILIVRQEKELQRIAGFEHREYPVNGAHRGFDARGISVKA